MSQDLRLEITADLSQAQKALDKLRNDAQSAGKVGAQALGRLEGSVNGVNRAANSNALARYERQMQQLNGTASRMEGTFARLQSGAMGFVAALGGAALAGQAVRGFVSLADEATRLEGRLRLVTDGTRELVDVQTKLFDISQRTRSAYGSNVELYTRSAQALKQLGANSAQTLQLTETLNQAFAISGATSAEASSAIIQLSQAFSSGNLRGEEFNSIAEQGPRLLQALSDALGVTRGELRKLAENGQLTSKLVFDALLSQAPKIASEFGKVPRTVGSAMTQLGNDMLRTVGQVNQATGATDSLVKEIDRLRTYVASKDFADELIGIVRETQSFMESTRQIYNDLNSVFSSFDSNLKSVEGSARGLLESIGVSADTIKARFATVIEETVSRVTMLPSAAIAAHDAIVAGWQNFPEALGGVVIEASRRALLSIEELVDGAISLVNNGINSINNALGTSIGKISGVQGSLSGYLTEYAKTAGGSAGQAASQAFSDSFSKNQENAQKFVRDMLTRTGAYLKDTLNPLSQTAQEAAFAIRDLDASQGALATSQGDMANETKRLNVDLSDNTKELEKAEKITQRYNKGVQDRIRSMQDTVSGLQIEVELFGQSEGAVAAATFQYEALEAAKRAAADANRPVSQEELDTISAASGQVQALTDRLKELNDQKAKAERLATFEADLTFGAQIRGLTKEDQAIAEKLRSVGVDYLSVQGQQYAAQMKFNDALKETKDKAIDFQDIGESIFDTLNDSLAKGDGLLKSLANTFGKLANQLASQAFGKLFGGFFNPGQSTGIGSGASITPSITAAGNASAGGLLFTPSASPAVASNDNRQIQSLNSSLAATSKSAIEVARQFNGLNEKADSKVLDGFLRASGTWKGLSAADTAWCAAFANAAIAQTGGKGTGSNLASSFMNWGQGTNAPKVGDIVVLKPQARGASGHVGFVAGFGDGTVQVFGGNQSQGANTKSFGLDQVRSFRTSESLQVTKEAVSAGFIDSQKKIANGQAGISNAGMSLPSNVPIPTPRPSNNAGSGLLGGTNGWTGAGSILGVQYPAFSAMGGLSAGLGGFGSGYSSGSPLSGGLTGGLSGFMSGGPVGALIGLGSGILGGIFGGRAKRKEAHKQAAAQWEEMRPQYEAFDQSLSGEGKGQFREWITTQKAQLDAFMKVGGAAWKMGTGNSSAQFASTGTKMYARFQEMLEEFQGGFEDMLQDLSSGQGLGGAFAKGRAATKDLKKQIDGMIDDVSIAFGSADIGVPVNGDYEAAAKEWEDTRNRAIEMAKKAAGEYALTMLYTSKTTSDVEKSVDGFRGTAAGLQKVLESLGWTAEDAAKDIKDRLEQAISEMGKTFNDGFQREINDLSGTGYLNDIADLIKQRDQGLSDAKLLGVDPSVVTKWFALATQEVVKGSELTGAAFDDLIRKFPQLAGVIKKFSDSSFQAASQSFDAAESQLRSFYDQVKSFADGLSNFLDSIKIDESSPLSNSEKLAEARKQYEETLAKANNGDVTAQGELTGKAKEYLDQAREYYASSDQYGNIFTSVETELKNANTKATTQLDTMKAQVKSLDDINKNTLTMATALSDYLEAQKLVNSNRSWGVMADQNKAIWNDLNNMGINYGGNFGGGEFLNWVKTQLPSQQALINDVIAKWSAVYAPKTNVATGGPLKGYATGGIVMNGMWNRDSVMAKLAGGEHITRAPSVNNGTRSMLDYINRTGMVPGANDNGRMEGVERRLDRVIQTLATGFNMSTQAIEEGNGIAARQTDAMKLAGSR